MPTIVASGEIPHEENKRIFESINTQGLCSYKKIQKTITPNPVTQIQGLDGCICVNYVNLEGAGELDVQLALETAVSEEYCGVYGISLERQWPFQRIQSPALLQMEATERLMNSAVFVLQPPKKAKAEYELQYGHKAVVAFYELGGSSLRDAFAQNRDKSVLTGKKIPHSARVTEIKTTKSFSMQEVLAILVPEHLFQMAESIFKTNVISVPKKQQVLESIPEILHIYHDQKIDKPLRVDAPNYSDVLARFVREKQITEFSLHAVRLLTNFDFVTRKIVGVSRNQPLLKNANAHIMRHDSDDSAWISVHKVYGRSKEDMIARLERNQSLPRTHLDRVRLAAKYSTDIFDQLSRQTGDGVLSYVYQLSKPQREILEKMGIEIVQLPFADAIHYPRELTHKVTQVTQDFKTITESAQKIQSIYRGFWARKVICELQEKKSAFAQAESELAKALVAINKLSYP